MWVALAWVLGAPASVWAQPVEQGAPRPGDVHASVALSDEARRDVVRRVLAHPGIVQRFPQHRLVGIRARATNSVDQSGATVQRLSVVLFDHTALQARRVVLDATSGEVVATEVLQGRPQSSPEEFDEAVAIVRGDPELGVLLTQGGVIDGGFIVDDPNGSARRMMQLKLLSANRRMLVRSITVDLTRQAIAR